MKVLLVEDNAADARLFAELISELPGRPLELTSAASFAEAAPRLLDHDIVFLDLSLPDAHGLETVTRMLQVARNVPIVVLTGTDDDRVAVEAMKLGAQDYLLKAEITPSQIARSARYAIERKHAEQASKRAHQADEAARRARFLSSLSGAITSSLELATTLPEVAKLIVPTLGDYCAIDIVRTDGRLERVALATADPSRHEALARLHAYVPGSNHPVSPASRVVAENAPIHIELVRVESLTDDPELHEINRQLEATSLLCVPLPARGRVVGALTCVMGPSQRVFDEELQQLALQVGERIGLGIDNANLYASAQRAIQGRDELLAVVSHDLRNPLNIVALALQAISSDPSAAAGALPRAMRGVDRMQRLIEDLLDVARIDTGTLAVELRPIDVTAVVEETLEQHRGMATEKRISLVCDAGRPPVGANADRHRVTQVLANLMSNAFKFTPPGGVIRLGVEARGERVAISVADTGPGIPPEHLAHIFDRFWQPQRRRDGVGLGLAIVKGIVDAHGGTIEVDSKPGIGTTFRLLLERKELRATGVVAVVA